MKKSLFHRGDELREFSRHTNNNVGEGWGDLCKNFGIEALAKKSRGSGSMKLCAWLGGACVRAKNSLRKQELWASGEEE